MGELFEMEGTKISAAGLTFGLSFLIAVFLVIAGNMRISSMAGEINRRLPEDAQIDVYAGRWYKGEPKLNVILRLHAEMYPNSPKRWQMWILVLLGFAFGFGGFIASWVLPR